MKRNKNYIPELLAPAGNKEAFIAAVEAGADAIYCGGEVFNARMNAGNFSLPELEEAVNFAHKRGVKVHVTLNILLSDSELHEALEYAKKLWMIGVDALIIQDLGLAALIKESIPEFELHLSTQGTIYDLDGIRAAAKLGFSRVVLARELSLGEIETITRGIKENNVLSGGGGNEDNYAGKSSLGGAGKEMEIEIFCHGALCYCYSGQCQMSRAIGGRSGNRGGCAQPCRMIYRSFDEEGDRLNMAYPLSPSDYELIEYIPEISSAGVASIKIEGRMKSPEYVATVTSIYRKYLDEYASLGTVNISERDRLSLLQIFNRGFTRGDFLGREKAGDIMSGTTPKNKGIYLGGVSGCRPVTRKRDDRFLMEMSLDLESKEVAELLRLYPISKGDIIEVRKEDALGTGTSATITYLEEKVTGAADNTQRAQGNSKGSQRENQGKSKIIEIGDIKEKVNPGASVYRLVSAKQIEEAGRYFVSRNWHEGKFLRKKALEADVTSSGKDFLTLTIKDPTNGKAVSVKKEIQEEWKPSYEDFEGEGIGYSDLKERVEARFKNSLSKTGGTPFEISKVRFHGNFDFAIPVAQVNSMRRDALEEMERALSFHREMANGASKIARENWMQDGASEIARESWMHDGAADGAEEGGPERPHLELYFYDIETFVGYYYGGERHPVNFLCDGSRAVVKYIIPAAEFLMFEGTYGEKLHTILRENKGDICLYVTNVARGKEREIIEKNIDALREYCKEYEFSIYLGSISQLELMKPLADSGIELKADYGVNIYNDASSEVIHKMGFAGYIESLEVDNVHFGGIPLMTIGHENEAARIIDRKGFEYQLLKPKYTDNIILVKSMGDKPRIVMREVIDLIGRAKKSKRFYVTRPEFG